MTRFVAVLSLVFVCFSSGCASKYYYQEGKTLTQCKQTCKGCYAEFGKYQSPAHDEPGAYNIAYDHEGNFMDACMLDKGYSVVKENKLPLRVKREDPDRWASRRQRGFAGTLDE